MRASPRWWLIVLVVLAAVTSCTAGETSAATSSPWPTTGGTLRVAELLDAESYNCPFRMCGPHPFDPQTWTTLPSFELAHCCLMRTLLGYNGRSVEEGGTELRPDLASSLPTVSDDGLTWTFTLREGVHYAPPMADTEIVAADFIRSFERVLSPASPENGWWYPGGIRGGYFVDQYLPAVIEGAQAFAQGKGPDHIVGLEAVDTHTLVIHLNQPTGDLGARLAQTQLGPIPADPAKPDAPFGVATGHEADYGDYIVSSGPYMFEGTDALDLSLPASEQSPPAGNALDHTTLVRNPSWSPAVDPLHTASSDRIEFYRVADGEAAERLVRAGVVDVAMEWSPDPATVTRWRRDAGLRDRMYVSPQDEMTYVALNVAVPPFDDLAVRRSVDLVVGRSALAQAATDAGGSIARPMTHIALDSLENNLLVTWSPPGVTPGGDPDAARATMATSRYDRDHDGVCDATVCRGLGVYVSDNAGRVAIARLLVPQLAAIGLDVRVHVVDDATRAAIKQRHPMTLSGWAKDFPSASTFIPLFSGDSISKGCCSVTMLGASPGELRKYGYTVRSVPSVDARIEDCRAQLFAAQVTCWAAVDQYLSADVVPIVPLTQTFDGWAVSPRVRSFTVDAAVGVPYPSLGAITVVGDPIGPAPTLPDPSPRAEIPDGAYTTTVPPSELRRLFPAFDPEYLSQVAGDYTIRLEGGRFSFVVTGPTIVTGPTMGIGDPMIVGSYSGVNDRVVFSYESPPWIAHDTSELRWREQGGNLRFTLDHCTGEAARYADECALQTALFTGAPWVRIGS